MVTPVGFWSYARQDDAHSDGHLSQLRVIIGKAIGLRYGGEVTLWQDVTAIPFGADWEKEIGRTVGQTTFFVPIVTPRFLRSTHCHQEYVAFRARMQALGRDDLVFPIHYVDIEDLEPADTVFGDDLTRLRGHQWIDFRPFLHTDPRSHEMRAQADIFAKGILLTMRRVAEDERRAVEASAHLEAERQAAEAKAREEAERQAAEARAKEANRLAAETRARDEAKARGEAERHDAAAEAREEAERQAAETRAKDEAERVAAEKTAREEAERLQAEAKAREDAARAEAEAKEAERTAAEAKARRDAEQAPARADAERRSGEEGQAEPPPTSKSRRWVLTAGGGAVAVAAAVLVSRGRDTNARAGAPLATFKDPDNGAVLEVAFVPDSRTAIFSPYDVVRLLDLDSGRVLRTFDDGGAPLAVAPDGRTFLCGNNDSTKVRVVELDGGATLRTLPIPSKDLVTCVAIAPDGKIAVVGMGHTLEVWTLATGQIARSLRGHKEDVGSIAIASDSRTAISGSTDKSARLWDLTTGRNVSTFDGQADPVAISPDGTVAVSAAGEDNNYALNLLNLKTGAVERSLRGHKGRITSVAIAPDGKTALSGSDDKTLKLWDLATGRELRRFIGHKGIVYSVAIAADGRTALSGSEDGTLKLWDLT